MEDIKKDEKLLIPYLIEGIKNKSKRKMEKEIELLKLKVEKAKLERQLNKIENKNEK